MNRLFTEADMHHTFKVVDHPAEGMHAVVFWVHASGDRVRAYTIPNKSSLLLRPHQVEPAAPIDRYRKRVGRCLTCGRSIWWDQDRCECEDECPPEFLDDELVVHSTTPNGVA